MGSKRSHTPSSRVDFSKVFSPHDDEDPPAATASEIKSAETALGVRLPDAFKQLMRHQDGGSLRFNTIMPTEPPLPWHSDGPAYRLSGDRLSVVGNSNDFTIVRNTRFAREDYGDPNGLVMLMGDGHRWLCLDYRSVGPDGHPPVIHYENDSESPTGKPEEHIVAESFEAFLAGLEFSSSGEYIIHPPQISQEELKAALRPISARALRMRHNGCLKWTLKDFSPLDGSGAKSAQVVQMKNHLTRGRLVDQTILDEPWHPDAPLHDDLLLVEVDHGEAVECVRKILALVAPSKLIHQPRDGTDVQTLLG